MARMGNPASDFEVASRDGVTLSGEQAGEGPSIVLLHGLTATRRYVLMGSRTLERSGHHVIAYDARGHGRSAPAATPAAYGYELLVEDLCALLAELQIKRAVLAGASMGAHTAVRFALERPEQVTALCLITPAFDPDGAPDYSVWDALAQGLREGGVEGFLAAYDLQAVPVGWRDTLAKVLRQRLAAHEHPAAVADALEAVPRSRPFHSWAELKRIEAPTVVVASRDQADPGHPLAVGERYAMAVAGAEFRVEHPGSSPIAWQGGQLSRLLAELTTKVCM
jgi:pimeloyl-ACP methyl ester carboxylesterase